VVALRLGVVYEVAVLNDVPPEETLYQATLPPDGAVAVRVTVPVPHLAAPLAEGAEGFGFMVATTFLLAAERHPVVRLR